MYKRQERLLTQKPAAADPYPPAMIPLNSGAPMNMAPLAPTPSGSQLGGAAQRSVDQMQRRVNDLRRDADTTVSYTHLDVYKRQ